MGLVYQITNLLNGKRYIGITTYTLAKRWYEHRWSARNLQKPAKTTICRALRKYGSENFSAEEIFHAFDDSVLPKIETHLIRTLAPEYNQTGGGEITKGRAHSEEGRKLMSDKKKKFYQDHPEEKQRMAAIARSVVYTESRRKRLSVMGTGRRHSDVAKQKMSDVAKECNSASRFIGFHKNISTPVLCINDQKVFESAKAADLHYGFSLGATWKVIAGKLKSIHGLKFVKRGVVAILQ